MNDEIDPKLVPLLEACIENERTSLKKSCTVWISSDSQVEPLQISDAVVESSFPVFKSEFRETKVQRLERWGKEYKDIARRQEAYARNSLAIIFVDEVLKDDEWCTDNLHTLASNMHDIFVDRIGYFQIQYTNVKCTIHGTKIVAEVEYKLRESMTSHKLTISNQK